MSLSRTIQVIAAVVLGVGAGAALASHFTASTCSSSPRSESANSLTDTSGICASDYCGCFEDLSRSQVLTRCETGIERAALVLPNAFAKIAFRSRDVGQRSTGVLQTREQCQFFGGD
jgi:hypothetical protein